MSTITITAADVNKLRAQTGAGMMDCKKALTEANGDFEQAIDYLRKKGQKVAANRADRDAKEGYILAKTNADGTKGFLIGLGCETDFVAKSGDFTKFVEDLLDLAVANNIKDVDALKALPMGDVTVNDRLFDIIGKIGEKIEITSYEVIEAPKVVIYIHPGNRVVAMVGLSSASAPAESGKDVAMQIAAMNPVAIDKNDVDVKTLEREIEIGKEQARAEGKPEEMLEKIAQGKLNKFYKESTLLNQQFIKDDKMDIRQYLDKTEKGLTVNVFRRVQIG
ncbi:MAG: elongation factor Ts [Bacteroidia bacterium]|nr:elongation factor Ts [Bacteroidota bacterium]MBP9083114.1 elongation factor Ts [Bacteroidia bacterium]MBK8415827.1 elongation factor Ts [Bacteroidota bacterium]MBK9045228.1 elongation factor Ts [Bacteroidota bacterium]MBK9423090.1 elongation factor Ts [Bacteroidota bacterium]